MANTAFFARNGLNVNNVFIVNSTAAAIGSNAILSFADYKIGNSTVNATINSTGVTVNLTNGVNNAIAQLTTDAAGQYGSLELGGNVGGFIDFKSPIADDYDARISANNTALVFLANTWVANGALIGDQTTNNVTIANTLTLANTFKIGTSTSNVVANTTIIKIQDATSTTNVVAGGIAIGTSVTNTTTFAAGANVIIGTVDVKIGNSTVNTFANSVLVKVANSTMTTNVGPGGVVTGTSTVNTTVLAAGANVIVNTSSYYVGNSTVNTVIRSDSFTSDGTFVYGKSLGISSTDLDSLVAPGFYDGQNLTNSPDGGTDWWYIMVQTHSNISTYVSQIASSLNNQVPSVYYRRNVNSVWSAWFRLSDSTNGLLQGKHTLWIPAGAMIARTSNGAATGTVEMTTNKNMFSTLDFDFTNAEYAQFEVAMPKSWDLSTVTFQPVWSHASTTTNFGVVWELAGVARSDDDAGDVAFGTAQSSTDTGGTTNDIYIGPESSAITIAGTPAVGDTVQFQVNRAPVNASDTMQVDARLHGVKVYIGVNAGNDV